MSIEYRRGAFMSDYPQISKELAVRLLGTKQKFRVATDAGTGLDYSAYSRSAVLALIENNDVSCFVDHGIIEELVVHPAGYCTYIRLKESINPDTQSVQRKLETLQDQYAALELAVDILRTQIKTLRKGDK